MTTRTPRQRLDRYPRDFATAGPQERGGMDLNAEKQKRAALATAARELLDAAEAENRNLTAEEARLFDQAVDQLDAVDKVIREEEARRARMRDLDAGGDGRAGPTFVLDGGRKVRGLLHGERASLLWRGRGPADDGIVTLDSSRGEHAEHALGRAVLQMVTGRELTTPEERDMTGLTGPGGAFFLSETLSNTLIDQIRAQLVLSRAGAVTVPLETAETRFVKIDEDPTATWHEELDTIPAGDVGLGSILMRPNTLVAMIRLGQELVDDTGRGAAAQVEAVMSRAIAAQLDRALFRGGLELPGGILSFGIADNPDLNIVDMGGSPPVDYSELLDAIQFCEEANINPNVRIDSPRTKRQYSGFVESTTGQPLRAPASVAELTHLVSSTVPVDLGAGTDESLTILGDFTMAGAMVLLGVRQAFTVAVTNVGAEMFERLGVAIRVHGRFDLAVARPAGLTRIEAIGPTP